MVSVTVTNCKGGTLSVLSVVSGSTCLFNKDNFEGSVTFDVKCDSTIRGAYL